MMKKSMGPETYLFPLPAVVVRTCDPENRPNVMTASWTGVVNSDPPMISVSLRKATYSFGSLLKRRAFTVSIPSEAHLVETDFIGSQTGRRIDKFAAAGLTAVKSALVDAPYVKEFPTVLECELVKYEDLGLHTIFIGRILDVKIDEDALTPGGDPDIGKLAPVSYSHGTKEYFRTGISLGRSFRRWHPTLLNERHDTPEKKEIVTLARTYYNRLDEGAPVEAFDELIDWDRFEMTNGNLRIDSREKYVKWYDEISRSLYNRKHVVEKLKMTEVSPLEYGVEIDMAFTGESWTPGDAKSRPVTARGLIRWTVKRDDPTDRFRLVTYDIEE